ncbi:glycosyltransferase family A protein [uncultured Cyclobacterium sp.]|uniref:glycosyltransferase family 2 protein n=1 Tax=uncultured Cyclobacterium sp. TaxID=453820 RepID=UPI0030EDCA34
MFSIIIPLYNKARYIQRAIEAVLAQTFQEFEIIVVNDGSTDGGEKLLEGYKDDRIKIINKKNQGVSIARNTGIKHANFFYIAFLDADDYWHKNYLKITSDTILKFKDVAMIGSYYSRTNLLEETGSCEVLILRNYFSRAIHNTLFSSSSTIIRKDFFEKNEGFKPKLKIGEDLDLWFRAVSFFGKVFFIKEQLVFYDLSGSESNLIEKDLKVSILSEFLKKNYLHQRNDSFSIRKFKEKFILFNLFEYYSLNSNKPMIKSLLKEVGSSYRLIRWFYKLPSPILKGFFSKKPLSKLFRNYMKFCFRYIYV